MLRGALCAKESTGDTPTKTITSRFSLNWTIEHLLEAILTLQSDQITLYSSVACDRSLIYAVWRPIV